MAQHPAGIFQPARPFRKGPRQGIYFSALSRPNQNICFMVTFNADTPSVQEQSIFYFQTGVGHCLSRRKRTYTSLTPETYRFSNLPLITASEDTPADTQIMPNLLPIDLERQIDVGQDGTFSSSARASVGQITLKNDDGSLDGVEIDKVIAGRSLTISVAATRINPNTAKTEIIGENIYERIVTDTGHRLTTTSGKQITTGNSSVAGVLSGFGYLFSGYISSASWNRQQVSFLLEDATDKLNQPVQKDLYTGNGGVDGPEAMRDTSKPVCFGSPFNIEPVLIDPANLVYQFHAGEAREVVQVRDKANPLTLHTIVSTYEEMMAFQAPSDDVETPDFPLGTYLACPKQGCFRLAGQPAGRITADVRGAGGADSLREAFSDGTLFTDGTGWRNASLKLHSRTGGAVIARLLNEYANLSESEVNLSQISQASTEKPYSVGLYLPPGSGTTILDCLYLLCRSIGMILIRAKDGRYQLRNVSSPSDMFALTIDDSMIDKGSLERRSLAYRQPWSQIDVQYKTNYTVMSDTDFVDAVAQENRIQYARPNLIARSQSNSIKAIYPDRPPMTIDTCLVSYADALEVGQAALDFYSHGRTVYFVRVYGISYRLELLDTVRLISSRFGLSAGKNLLVTGIKELGAIGATEVLLFG